jgi:hypothetical protein
LTEWATFLTLIFDFRGKKHQITNIQKRLAKSKKTKRDKARKQEREENLLDSLAFERCS